MDEPLVRWLNIVHQCPCGSGLLSTWYKDEHQKDIKACNKCKVGIIFKIFEEYFIDIFENWLAGLMFADRGKAPIGYEFQWEDFLKEKKCIRSKETKSGPDYIVIRCPENEELYIQIPKEYAEKTLLEGKIV